MFNGKFNRAVFGADIWSIAEVKRMIYNGKVVFNRAEYVLSVPEEIQLEATSHTWEDAIGSAVFSYKTERNGEQIPVDYRLPEGEIERNDSTRPKTGTYIVEQMVSGLRIEGVWTQEGKRLLKYYIDKNSVIAEEVSYESMDARGGVAVPAVKVYADKYAEYSNGTSEYVGRVVGDSSVTYASGRVADIPDLENYDLPVLDTDTGEVTVDSLRFNETEAPMDVFYVTRLQGIVTFEGFDDELTWNWRGKVPIEQDANSCILVDTKFYMDAYVSSNRIEVTDTSFDVSGYAYKVEKFRYDAMPSTLHEKKTDETLYVTLNNQPESVQFIRGEEWQDVTFTVGANTTESERVFTVQMYNNEADFSKEESVVQDARVFTKWQFYSVNVLSVDYEDAYPYASTSVPSVVVQVGYKKEFSDGTTDSEIYKFEYNGEVGSASGFPYDDSGATINPLTGVVSVKGLPHEWKAATPVFEVTELSGTVYAELTNEEKTWRWKGSADVIQMENERGVVSRRIVKSSSVDKNSLECEEDLITVNYRAQELSTYQWASDRYGEFLEEEVSDNYPLTISVSGDYSASKTVRDGWGTVTFNVGVNESTSSSRYFTVKVSSSSLGTIGSHDVEQERNYAQIYWGSPSLNGVVTVEDILANGEGVPVLVPIKQIQYRTTTLNPTPVVVDTYTGSVYATAIGGTALSGAGVLFSEGYISANNLGKQEMEKRTVYTLKSVTVLGQDGKSYSLTLPSSVAVKQEANEKTTVITSSTVDISPTNLTIAATASTKTIYIYAASYKRDDYTSGEKVPYTDSAPVVLSVVGDATISPTSMTTTVNGKPATLSVKENIKAERTISVTATANSGDPKAKSITRTYNQSEVDYFFAAGDEQDCSATASKVKVVFTSSRNGTAWEPDFKTNLSGATIDSVVRSGTEYTVTVGVPENEISSNREIIVTATQARYNGNATATVTITQAAAAAPNLPLAGVELEECIYTDDNLSNVRYSLYFTAKDSTKYQGGTLKNVVVQLNTKPNGSGSVLGSPRNLGNISVAKGSQSSTYSGTFNAGGRVAYLLVYWDDVLQYYTAVEEYVPE